jgi:hypothetical protein
MPQDACDVERHEKIHEILPHKVDSDRRLREPAVFRYQRRYGDYPEDADRMACRCGFT